MKLTKEELNASEIDYLKFTNGINEKAKEAKVNLFTWDEKHIKKLSKVEIGEMLRSFHRFLMFSKSEELLTHLKKFKVKNNILRWFVSLDDINKEFDLLKAKGILIDKPFALFYIVQYLAIKFAIDVMAFSTDHVKRDEVSMNSLTKSLIDNKNRQEYGSENPRGLKSVFDILIADLVNSAVTNTEGEFTIDLFINVSKGKIEKIILKLILENCFYYDQAKINKTKFLSAVYGLFRIIIQDYVLINEEEFIESDILENNFDTFKAKKLKKIIYKK